MIFLADLLMTNTSTGRIALIDAAATGMASRVHAEAPPTPPPTLPLH